MGTKKTISRRDFLRGAGGTLMFAATGASTQIATTVFSATALHGQACTEDQNVLR